MDAFAVVAAVAVVMVVAGQTLSVEEIATVTNWRATMTAKYLVAAV